MERLSILCQASQGFLTQANMPICYGGLSTGLTPTKGTTMPKKINIHAVYKNSSLTPLGRVDIDEGEVVSLTIEVEDKLSREERIKKLKSTAGAWADNSEYWEEFKQYIYESRSRGID